MIDINALTIGQAKEIAAHFSGLWPATNTPTPASASIDEGLCICVLDKGFVYVGYLTLDSGGKTFTISNAQNIRRWGTTAGLGQLAEHGLQEDTILDPSGTVRALSGELKHWIQCRSAAWK